MTSLEGTSVVYQGKSGVALVASGPVLKVSSESGVEWNFLGVCLLWGNSTIQGALDCLEYLLCARHCVK